MESLAPPLKLCIDVRLALECGESLFSILKKQTRYIPIDFRKDVIGLIYHFEQQGTLRGVKFESKSQYRVCLLTILGCGLAGDPIVQRLVEFEAELKIACEDEVDAFIAGLPLKALIPILLIQFPAFLLLLFGPILKEFMKGLM